MARRGQEARVSNFRPLPRFGSACRWKAMSASLPKTMQLSPPRTLVRTVDLTHCSAVMVKPPALRRLVNGIAATKSLRLQGFSAWWWRCLHRPLVRLVLQQTPRETRLHMAR